MDTSQYQSKTSGEWEAFRSDAIIRAAHDGIITADAIGDIETVNPAAELIFGWTAAELAGKNFRFLMPRSDAGKQNAYMPSYLDADDRRVIGKGRRVDGLHKDGTLFPIEITVTEMEISGKTVFAGIIRDVTDRVAAEEALRLSNELMKSNHARLEAVLENMPEGLILVDEHLNVAVQNDRYFEMLNLPREKLGLGTPFEAHLRYHAERNGYGPGDVNQIVADRMEATRHPVAEKFENTLPDGRVIDIHRNPMPGGGFVMTFADVTEHKAAVDALRASNAELETYHHRLEMVLDNMQEGLGLIDSELNMVVQNKRFYELTKLPPEQLKAGMPYEAFVRFHSARGGLGPGDVDALVAARMETLNHSEPQEYEVTQIDDTPTEVRQTPVPGGGFVVTFTDITERKAAEDALRISNERLEAHRQRLEQELNLGRDMQAALMPSDPQLRSIEDANGCRFDTHFETSSELGGDFWGPRQIDEHRLGIFLVDFSGHGVGAALNTFRLHSLMAELPPPLSPAAHLDELNRLLVDLIPRGQFATMFYGIMDTKADALTYSAAAAPSPLISMPNSNNFGEIGEIIVAEARGKPLGISAEAEYTDHHLAFPPGAFLFLYSDALIEGRDEHGDMLGVDGLSSLLSRRSMAKSDSSPLGDVLDLFNARSRLPLQDDLTAIWLSRSN